MSIISIEMPVLVAWMVWYGDVQGDDQSLGIEYRSKAACERVMASPSPAKGAVLLCMD